MLFNVTKERPPATPPKGSPRYARFKERARAAAAEVSREGREIGDIPPVADQARKDKAADDFLYFCRTYFPHTFYLPWSDDHKRVAGKLERAVRYGGQFAQAMPRGDGKTCFAESGTIWAVLYGYHEFVALIGADEGQAHDMLESIRMELETNELLYADFPEAVHAVRSLEGISHRCKGQLYQGKRTFIGWTANQLIMPTIPGSKASGAIIRVAGITGRIRGMKHKRPDGAQVRPTLAIIDDPQTDESARSPAQCHARLEVLNGAILNLPGPGKVISAIVPCTVIRSGDMADFLLDPKKSPLWQGERTQILYSFPNDMNAWEEYARIYRSEVSAGRGGAEATKYYRRRRKAMDAGAIVAWPARKSEGELSALEHCMRLYIRDPAAFFSEYMNQPQDDQHESAMRLTSDDMITKLNGMARRHIPAQCNYVTAFVDVHDAALYYIVVAWQKDFTGAVIDYGTHPDQKRHYFTLREAKQTLRREYVGTGSTDAAILAGLNTTLKDLTTREYRREDGALLQCGPILIDTGYKPEIVRQAIRHTKRGSSVLGSRGQGIRAADKPLSEYRRYPGDLPGHYWRIPRLTGARSLRTVHIDTNYWKTFIHERLTSPLAAAGGVTLWGREGKGEMHRMIADQVATAEVYTPVTARGRTVNEWRERPSRPDNHYLDCIVGAAVGASMAGCVLTGTTGDKRRTRKKRRKRTAKPL